MAAARVTRDTILEAAIRVVARAGLAGSSLGAVARDAGTSKTAIVYHFGSAERLRAAIAARLRARLLESAFRNVPAHLRVDDLARVAIGRLLDHEARPLWAAGRELSLLGARDERVAAGVRATYDELTRVVVSRIEGPPERALRVGRSIVAALEGHVDLWLCSGEVDPVPFRESALRAVHALLQQPD